MTGRQRSRHDLAEILIRRIRFLKELITSFRVFILLITGPGGQLQTGLAIGDVVISGFRLPEEQVSLSSELDGIRAKYLKRLSLHRFTTIMRGSRDGDQIAGWKLLTRFLDTLQSFVLDQEDVPHVRVFCSGGNFRLVSTKMMFEPVSSGVWELNSNSTHAGTEVNESQLQSRRLAPNNPYLQSLRIMIVQATNAFRSASSDQEIVTLGAGDDPLLVLLDLFRIAWPATKG